MRKDELFGNREQESLKTLGPATMYVLNAMKPTLDANLKAQSVVNNSLDFINSSDNVVNNVNDGFDPSLGQGQSETRAKVRVLTPNNTPGVRSSVSEVNNSFDTNRNYYAPSAGYSDNSQSNSNVFGNIGSAQTLILIFTAILVVMVFLVSFVIMNFLGV